jgi:hypothetical protein
VVVRFGFDFVGICMVEEEVVVVVVVIVIVVVVVNKMARGKHRSSAHKRESGFGDSIVGDERCF